MKYIVIIFVSFLPIACFEPDERVLPYPGEITTISDSVQTYQSWFDLESGTVVSVNRTVEWELAFESDPEGWRILVNSGADWFIYNTGSPVFPSTIQMPQQLEGKYDVYHLWPDSTATGEWTLHNNTYLMARYHGGAFNEYIDIRLLSYSDTSYLFCFQDSVETDTVLLMKNPETNFSYYSFRLKTQVYPEPPRSTYDLLFTSYYDKPTLFGQTIPYKVGGVLLNPWNTSALIDSVHPFEAITAGSLSPGDLINRRDIPGYNWKDVVVDISGGGTATYTVKTGYNYVIRTAQGNYFRLRFLSYTLDGRSGFPRFEFSLLQ